MDRECIGHASLYRSMIIICFSLEKQKKDTCFLGRPAEKAAVHTPRLESFASRSDDSLVANRQSSLSWVRWGNKKKTSKNYHCHPPATVMTRLFTAIERRKIPHASRTVDELLRIANDYLIGTRVWFGAWRIMKYKHRYTPRRFLRQHRVPKMANEDSVDRQPSPNGRPLPRSF